MRLFVKQLFETLESSVSSNSNGKSAGKKRANTGGNEWRGMNIKARPWGIMTSFYARARGFQIHSSGVLKMKRTLQFNFKSSFVTSSDRVNESLQNVVLFIFRLFEQPKRQPLHLLVRIRYRVCVFRMGLRYYHVNVRSLLAGVMWACAFFRADVAWLRLCIG